MSHVNFFPLQEYPLLYDVIVVRLKPANVVMHDSRGNECLTMWPLKTLRTWVLWRKTLPVKSERSQKEGLDFQLKKKTAGGGGGGGGGHWPIDPVYK